MDITVGTIYLYSLVVMLCPLVHVNSDVFKFEGKFRRSGSDWTILSQITTRRFGCVKECSKARDCVSFNHDEDTKSCELLQMKAMEYGKYTLIDTSSTWSNFYNANFLHEAYLGEDPDTLCLAYEKPSYDDTVGTQFVCVADKRSVDDFNGGAEKCFMKLEQGFTSSSRPDLKTVANLTSWKIGELLVDCFANNCLSLQCEHENNHCFFKNSSEYIAESTWVPQENRHYWAPKCY